MLDFDSLNNAIDLLTASLGPWWAVVPGILIGMVSAAIPGISISMAMAVVLPVTLFMDFVPAMLFLTAVFTGGGFGAGIPAIIMNIPGEAGAVATAFDGYPMAQRGQHNEALGVALAASTAGAAFGYIVLLFLIFPISTFVIKLGPSEFFVIVCWGLTLIAVLRGKHFFRGILSGLIGLLAGTIGMNAVGTLRGTMGIPHLLDGIPIIPAMVGLFAASALFDLVNKEYLIELEESRRVNVGKIFRGMRLGYTYPLVMLRGSIIGTLIGAIPGIGTSVSNLVSYAETKKRDANPASFGTGNPKGVVAAESANSSGEGGSLITLLSLGIPGGGATAVMLAAFSMHNITGGPQFIREHTDIVYAIILANFVQVILLLVLGLIFIRVLLLVVKVPVRFLIPSVLTLAVFGAYGQTGNLSGPVTVLVFGLIGWWATQNEYSIPAMVIGLLLGRMAEGELLRTYRISGGELGYLTERPLTLLLLALLVTSVIIMPLWRARRPKDAPKLP
jgi:putative tricarboxylic transport membrane protein